MFEYLGPALSNLLSFQVAGLIVIGVMIGILGGALPGISAPVTIALVLPLTFTLKPVLALVVLAAVYMAAQYGGSISAVLINTPGTPGAISTALDGYPMSQQGRGREALHASVIGSSIGGLFGTIILLLFTPALAEFSLRFGSAELFWISIAGLSIVCSLTAKDFIKGVISAGIGLFVASIGIDPALSIHRFTYNIISLEDGISLIPATLGLFAVAQMLVLTGGEQGTIEELKRQPGAFSKAFLYAFKRPFLILRSSLIGVLIGILPGAGGSIASFVSYGEAKRFSKEPEKFGKGTPEGVFASECANNAMVGGSLVPLLAFGIPGCATAAILFGALTINGLVPGHSLFSENGPIVYAFILSFIPTIAVMLLLGALGAKWLAALLRVHSGYIIPTVLMLAVIGSYSMRSNIDDVYVTVVFGTLGYVMSCFGFNLAPIVLGMILGPMAEEGFRRSMHLGELQGSVWLYFFGRPISVVLIIITVLMVVTAFWQEAKTRRKIGEGVKIIEEE